MNAALENAGSTVSYIDPVPARPESHAESFKRLVADMEAGEVETLVILGGNPVFTAPADVPFAKALEKVRLRAHLSPYQDETSALCQWHVPEAHFLESWSDARAFDGTASIVQPLIAPLYGGKTAHEAVAALTSQPERSSYEIVRDYWKDKLGPDFEASWRRALHDGVIAGTRVCAEGCRSGPAAACSSRPGGRGKPRPRPDRTESDPSRSSSAPIRRSMTGASPTTPGCRSFPSRSRS